ncbi:MAG: YaiO family outer membrane beta-barrel protein [Ginsengibacter sp.]|jgi:YaiO family outer membrane protein
MKYAFYLLQRSTKRLGLSALIFLIFSISFLPKIQAQNTFSSDELFQMARRAAFDSSNYPKAIEYCKEALIKAPNYSDIRIFLGRIYTWTKQKDSARAAFTYVLNSNPDNEDAASAFTDLEYWSDNYSKALEYCNQGLLYHPKSEDLLLKKSKIFNAMKNFKEANNVIDTLLQINPKNEKARAFMNTIKDNSSINKISIGYNYVSFDKQFSDPWHLLNVAYSRSTNLGSLVGRINYANRFQNNGVQGEVDFYPKISKTFYSYLNMGISGTNNVFPRFRMGASLYANLPWSMEGEIGFRYLKFTSNVWMYTASVGKYYSNFWFNLRTFLVPSYSNLSQSYTLTTRYYTGGADDYIYLSIGTGVSPDDPANAPILGLQQKLKSQKIGAGFNHTFNRYNIISINGTWSNQEYKAGTYGNQYDLGISYQRKF